MTFWQKIKDAFRKFMMGRHGADQLGQALMVAGLVILLLNLFLRSPILILLWLALYVYAMFRIFSRNNEKRWAENQKYVAWSQNFRTNTRQATVRLKNSKKYKYFRCPKCNSWLKLPRKVGEVTITCGKCGNAFKKKA